MCPRDRVVEITGQLWATDRKASGNQPGLESDLDRVLAALLMARRLPACGAGGREGAPGTATATVLVSAELWQQRPPMISIR